MKSTLVVLGIVCTMLLSACSIGNSNGTDPTATTVVTAVASTTVTNTPEPSATATNVPPTSTATTPASTATQASDTAPTATSTGSELDDQIAEIERKAAELRGLELLEPVHFNVITRSELRQNLIDSTTEEYSQEDADEDTDMLWLLRLIDDPDLDLLAFQIDLLSEQVLGYYDPETDEMFIVSDADGLSALAEFTLAHELVHAIQDQHFDLMQVRFYDQGDNDRDTAAVALFEGDADFVQMQYIETMSPTRLLELLNEANSLSSSVTDSAPPYLRESLFFPYEFGPIFVQALHSEDGVDSINSAFVDPPLSTEQVLHPEKYLDERDDPIAVDLTDLSAALGAGWEQHDTDTLGEFDLRILLRENGARGSQEAAAGWGGARYTYYRNGASTLMAVKTVWDSPADATEFYDALLTTLAGPLDGEIGDAGQGRYIGVRDVDGAIWFVTSTDRASVEAALAGIGG